jgi:hypothetical protein
MKPFDCGTLTNETVSYTYPNDYGSKPGSGNPFWAGRTDIGRAMALDPRHNPWAEYRLSDWDVEVLHRRFPDYDGTSAFAHLPELEGLLLTEFNRSAAELLSLTWPNIIAILATRNPLSGDSKSMPADLGTNVSLTAKGFQRQKIDKTISSPTQRGRTEDEASIKFAHDETTSFLYLIRHLCSWRADDGPDDWARCLLALLGENQEQDDNEHARNLLQTALPAFAATRNAPYVLK